MNNKKFLRPIPHENCKKYNILQIGIKIRISVFRIRFHNPVSFMFSKSGERERVLFIGTQFSILYTSMYSPAEAATHGLLLGIFYYNATPKAPPTRKYDEVIPGLFLFKPGNKDLVHTTWCENKTSKLEKSDFFHTQNDAFTVSIT